MGIETPVKGGSIRRIRVAGYLAMLFGIFGAMSGFAAAGTFIPFRHEATYNSQFAEVLTVIAVIGAVFLLLGVVSSWGLLRGRGWAWGVTLASAVGCVASVGVMTAFWPSSWGFLTVVAMAYALEASLLLLDGEAYRARTVRATPS